MSDTPKEKNKGGRPKIPMITEDLGDLEKKLPPRPIELRQVMYWMDLGATAQEIAGAHHVSVDTLDRRLKEELGLPFAELKKKCCGASKIKLRNNQFKLSEKNASMGIWLGKQWLGQRDLLREVEEFSSKIELFLDSLKKMERVTEGEEDE